MPLFQDEVPSGIFALTESQLQEVILTVVALWAMGRGPAAGSSVEMDLTVAHAGRPVRVQVTGESLRG